MKFIIGDVIKVDVNCISNGYTSPEEGNTLDFGVITGVISGLNSQSEFYIIKFNTEGVNINRYAPWIDNWYCKDIKNKRNVKLKKILEEV